MASPNHGPTSPNLTPVRGAEYVSNLPDIMQIDAIEDMRKDQGQFVEQEIQDAIATEGRPLTDAEETAVRDAAIATLEDRIKLRLETVIPDTDPLFDRYKTIMRDLSLDKIDDVEWTKRNPDPHDSSVFLPSKRMTALEGLRTEFDTTSPAPAPTPVVPKTRAEVVTILDSDTALKDKKTKVDILRTQLAELTAEKQRKMNLFGGRLNGDLNDKYDAKQQQYQDAVNDLARAEIQAEKDAGLDRTETEERLDAAYKLVDSFRLLQEKSVEEIKGTKVAKLIRMLTSGSMPVRILKGAALGMGVGLAVGALAGGTAIAGVAGVVALGATRYVRGYARSDNKRGRGMDAIDAPNANSDFNKETVKEAGAEGKGSDETIDLVNAHLLKQLEADTKQEQSKRRRSALAGLGAVAVGSLASEGFHLASEAFSNGGLHLPGSGGHETGARPGSGAVDDTPKPPHGGGTGGQPEAPVPAADEISVDASTMESGEGLFQTMDELNIPAADRPKLLELAGPKLHDIQVDGRPLTYRMPDGSWGLHMTADGTFPKEGLQTLMDTHDHMTGVGGADHIADTDTHGNIDHSTGTAANVGDTPSADAIPIPDGVSAQEAASVDLAGADSVLDKSVIYPSDVTGNNTLMQLSHVKPNQSLNVLGHKLGLNSNEWNPVKDKIAQHILDGDANYKETFRISPLDGSVESRDTITQLPPNIMADIMTSIPTSVRTRL